MPPATPASRWWRSDAVDGTTWLSSDRAPSMMTLPISSGGVRTRRWHGWASRRYWLAGLGGDDRSQRPAAANFSTLRRDGELGARRTAGGAVEFVASFGLISVPAQRSSDTDYWPGPRLRLRTPVPRPRGRVL